MPVFLQQKGKSKTIAIPKGGYDIAALEAPQKKKEAFNARLEAAKVQAQKYQQEADNASSFRGMASNAIKAAPQAIADTLVGTPAKFLASAYEAPKIAIDYAMGKGSNQNKTYNVPGLSPFKSYQSDFADVVSDVIDGKKGLGSAAWSLAQVPLAGAEMLGVGKGIGKGVKALAKGNVKEAGAQVADAFLPTNLSKKLPSVQDVRKQASGVQTMEENVPQPERKMGAMPDHLMNSEHGANVYSELDTAKAGERLYTPMDSSANYGTGDANFQGVPSSFPEWVPSDLRKKTLFNQVKESMLNNEYPKSKPAQRLYDVVHEEIAKRSGTIAESMPNTSITQQIPKTNLEEARLKAIGDIAPEGTNQSRFYPQIMRSGESSLTNQGVAGQGLRKLMEEQQVASDLKMGKWKALINEHTGQLNAEQKANLADVLEGKAKPMDKQVGTSSKVMRDWLNSVQKQAGDTGLNAGYREDYFPRKYNWDDMQKASRKEEIYQHMVDTGQASTKAEAQQFLNTFMSKNRERKAGNIEFERLYDVPGYERDPEKALTAYAESAAQRLTEAKYFGKKDEIPSALINKIAEGGGDYNEAQKVFDYVYKGEPKNAFADALLTYNTITKLSLGFFSNITQSANTIAKAGLLNTVKGAGQALSQGIKAMKGKGYDDIAVLSNALDKSNIFQESGLKNKIVDASMYLFGTIEDFNRRTSAYAGVNRANELLSILKKDPQSAFATRQLKSIGIDIEDVVRGKLTEKQLLTAANLMTRKTQFKIDALTVPTAWRGPLGKVLSQFKSFSFMQTKFIRDEILKEAKLGNFAPLTRFLLVAPVASFVTQSARNMVNRVDPNSEKANPSFRRGDLYRKAIGDIPTDFASQMKYAWDKQHSTYQDAKGNVYPSTSALEDMKNYTSPFTGPSVSDALSLGSAIGKVSEVKNRNQQWYGNHPEAQSDPYLDMKRFGASKVPYFGGAIKNTQFPYTPTNAKQAKVLLKEGIAKNDRGLIEQAMQEDPYLINENALQSVIGKKLKEMSPEEVRLYREIEALHKKKQPFYR